MLFEFQAKFSLNNLNRKSNSIHVNNFTIDFCAYFAGGLLPIFMNVFAPDFKNHTNLIQGCPMSGHFYVKDLPAEGRNVPYGLRPGKYVMEFMVYSKNGKIDHILLRTVLSFNFRNT